MIVSIHQPGYLPWYGLFHRLALSDLHIFFDSAQFEKNGFNNRVKVKTSQGGQWLTVPVLMKGRFGQSPISQTQINNNVNWRDSHWKTLLYNYSRAPYFKANSEFFRDLFSKEWLRLGDLNMYAVEQISAMLGIRCRFIKASQLNASGQKAELVLNLCKAAGASTYVSGINGRDYLNYADFKAAGIELRYQAFREPGYRQLHGEFAAFMSIADLLFNRGPESCETMMSGQASLADGTVS